MNEQSPHRVYVVHLANSGVLAPEVFNAQGSAHAPAALAQFFEEERRGLALARNLTHDLLQNILQRHPPSRTAKFVQHNSQSSLLTLEALQELQQIHRRRHE